MTATSTRSSATKKSTKNARVPRLRFPEFEGSEEWERTTIEKSCDLLNNHRAPIRASNRISGPIPYYGASGIVDYIDDYIFDDELLLVGEDGAKWGAFENTAFIVRGKCWVNNHAHVLKPHLLNILFLEAYLIKIDLFPYVTGAAPPKLTLTQLKSITIPLPSLPEQQKIADCLSSLDDLIAAEAEKLETLKVHKKGLMQELFPREGETTPRIRFPGFEGSGEWEVKQLGDIVKFQSGSTPSKANDTFWDGTIPWASAKDMKSFYLEGTLDHITEAAVKSGAKIAPTNSILILTRGMTLLRDIPICFLTRAMSFNQDVKALYVRKNKDPTFIAFLLLSMKPVILSIVTIAGHGTGRLDTDQLKALPLCIPTLPEQQKIASVLSSLDDRITAQSERIELLKNHKKGLMQQLFPVMEG